MKTCYFCQGPIRAAQVDHMAQGNAGYTLVKNLSVEQCGQCGEVYLDEAASKRIDEAVSEAATSREHLRVPVVHGN